MARRPDLSQEEMFTREDLKKMSRNLALLNEQAVRDIFQRAYRECRIVNSHQLPTARAIQELVQAWKQLRKWRKG
jgi:hypothetical protein